MNNIDVAHLLHEFQGSGEDETANQPLKLDLGRNQILVQR